MRIRKVYRLKTKVKDIEEILVDLTVYGRLHPLIINVIPEGDETNEGQRYRVVERPFDWLPLKISYWAVVRVTENQIEYKIEGLPMTRARVNYELVSLLENNIEVRFELDVRGLPIAERILANKMLDAQNQLMDSITRELVA